MKLPKSKKRDADSEIRQRDYQTEPQKKVSCHIKTLRTKKDYWKLQEKWYKPYIKACLSE